MGSTKPTPMKTPFENSQATTNTYAPFTIANTGEAQNFLDVPLRFGEGYKDIKTDFEVDPGVGRRTDLAEQRTLNEYDSGLMRGLPVEYRQNLRDSAVRKVREQGAAEAQAAEFARKQGEYGASVTRAQMEDAGDLAKTQFELGRRERLLPQILQTGGNSASSGFNTQLVQPQPGFGQQLLGGVVSGLASGLTLPKI